MVLDSSRSGVLSAGGLDFQNQRLGGTSRAKRRGEWTVHAGFVASWFLKPAEDARESELAKVLLEIQELKAQLNR